MENKQRGTQRVEVKQVGEAVLTSEVVKDITFIDWRTSTSFRPLPTCVRVS